MISQRTWSTFHGNVDELALVSLGFPLTIPVRVGNDARVCITTGIKTGDLQFAPRDFLRKKNSGANVSAILFAEFLCCLQLLTTSSTHRSVIQLHEK